MTYLLDVNVLLALLDPSHIHHLPARSWFDTNGHSSWASCPITENGTIRVLANPSYRNSPGSVAAARSRLAQFTALPGHVFWPDTISFVQHLNLQSDDILAPNQITDVYLLSLAAVNGGEFATFDRRIPAYAIPKAAGSLHLIPA